MLTYLKCIIESIDHVELLEITLKYLLALPDKTEIDTKPARPTTLARRRKSQTLISNLAQGQETPMLDLFTLVDLILTSLQSRNQQTVTATLRLVSVLLRDHHQYAVSSILKVQSLAEALPTRTVADYEQETMFLYSMIEDLIDDDDLGVEYEAHLQDAGILLESHCCSSRLLMLPDSPLAYADYDKGASIHAHTIRPDDPLIRSLITLLDDFLFNEISTNLGLTQAFSALASCGYVRLGQWFLGIISQREHPSVSNLPSGTDDQKKIIALRTKVNGDKDITDSTNDRESIKVTFQKTDVCGTDPSSVFASLDRLVNRVENFRRDIQDFDVYLAERRHVFRVGEDIDKAIANDMSPPRKYDDSGRLSISRTRGAAHLGPISERLMSATSSATGSRSSSPRGRQLSDPLMPKLADRIGHIRISPSQSPPKAGSQAFSPSPLQQDSIASTSSRRVVTPKGPGDALRQKIKFNHVHHEKNKAQDIVSETSSIQSESAMSERKIAEDAKEITLSHLLTNVIILQEFMLELVAIIQVRASLFGEVNYY